MRKFSWLTFLALVALLPLGTSANDVMTTVKKHAKADWTVTYKVESPVSRLAFKRSPDTSRTARWTPVSADFSIRYERGSEYIERLDKKSFTAVSFQLTPTYTSLPKDYAPFSPFSDGGMLFHSGRFFTCIDTCHSDMNSWPMQVVVPEGERILLNGELSRERATWLDSNSGRKVYVGQSTPQVESHFISVIDANLPPGLRDSLSVQLPELMDQFANNFGQLEFRPLLFASYSESSNGRYGNQGGTLPGQVFMHWYGQQAIDKLDSNATYWFFAHEVAHLYQRDAGRIEKAQDAWVHEGSAELFAGLASDSAVFKEKLIRANDTCVAALEPANSYAQASLSDFRVHYACGLVIMNAIHEDLRSQHQNVDLFALWGTFNNAVTSGKPASAKTFTKTVRPYLSADMVRLLESISNPDSNPVDFFRQLESDASQ
ncbi:hypothetical protein ACR0ST_05760 [Aliidiomarina sp. Khilg15.8]